MTGSFARHSESGFSPGGGKRVLSLGLFLLLAVDSYNRQCTSHSTVLAKLRRRSLR